MKDKPTRAGQELTVQEPQNRTETGQSDPLSGSGTKHPRLPKTHQDYWLKRLRKRSYKDADGRVVQVAEWQIRLFYEGKEAWFNLQTANKAAAASKARDVYVFLRANGWPATLAKFKPQAVGTPSSQLTFGEYLRAVEQTGLLQPKTFLNYQNCLRTILAGSFGIHGGKERFDYRTGGNAKWVARIERIRMAKATEQPINRWKGRFLKSAGKSPVAAGSARRTVNSYLRCARSLFSKAILNASPVKGLHLPSPLPLVGVELIRKKDQRIDTGSVRYVSKIDATALIAAAKADLKPNQSEAYKAFLLGLLAGLRKAEIDLLQWDMLDYGSSQIHLRETKWLRLKTEDSAGAVPVDPEVLTELRSFMAGSKSEFVITSTRRPRNDSARPYYRCAPVFAALNAWLREKGITANKPLHELRKEIGAMITTAHGIYAASRFLRHSDVTTTARHYADQKARVSVGLGKLLNTEIQAVEQATAQ